MKFKIRTKLIRAFFAIIFPFIILSGIITLYNVNNIRKATHRAETISGEMQAVMSLQIALGKVLMPTNDYIITGNKEYIDDFNTASKVVDDFIKADETLLVLKGMNTPEVKEEVEILKAVETAWQNIKEISQKIFEIRNPVGNKEASTLMEEMDYKWAYPAINMLDKHREIDRKKYHKVLEAVNRSWILAWIIMLAGGFMLSAAGVFFAVYYSNIFVRPINILHNGADKIANGDFKSRIDIKTGDELEQLANATNEMAVQLDSMYSNLEQKVEERTRYLKESEERFRNLAETTSDWVWEVNGNGVFTYSNLQLREILGYEVEEVLGKTIFDFARPEETRRVAEFFRATAATQKPFKFFENLTIHKDGHEVVIETSGVPYLGAEGKFIGYHGINRDITERKRAEQGRAHLVAILEATTDFIGFADAVDTHIFYINQAGRRMVGIGVDEDVTKLKIADVHPTWANKLLAEVALPTALREGVWSGECVFLNRDGREIPVLMVLLSHKDASGRVDIFSTISRDITEYKKTEALLRERLDELEQFRRVTIKRELRMKELKDENKGLKKRIEEVEEQSKKAQV